MMNKLRLIQIVNIQKENVDNLLRLRYLRHRQTPYNHIRVKAHAERREHLYFYSWLLLYIGDISGNKNLSGRFFLYVFSYGYLSP